jgi:hypothetical protein
LKKHWYRRLLDAQNALVDAKKACSVAVAWSNRLRAAAEDHSNPTRIAVTNDLRARLRDAEALLEDTKIERRCVEAESRRREAREAARALARAVRKHGAAGARASEAFIAAKAQLAGSIADERRLQLEHRYELADLADLRTQLSDSERAGHRRRVDITRERIYERQRRAELVNSLFHAQGAAIAELERELRDLGTATRRQK